MKSIQRYLTIMLLTLAVALTGYAHASSSVKKVEFNQAGFDKYKKVLYQVSQKSGESASTLAAYSSIETNLRALSVFCKGCKVFSQ